MEEIRNEMSRSCSLDSDESASSNNCVCYGPIRFFGRKGKAPTLSTGRKSKFEELSGEEFAQRESRREKNRLLSKRLKEKRDKIQNELMEQINKLENKNEDLLNHIERLNLYKNNLSLQIETLNEDPLIGLIQHNDLTLFFEEHNHQQFDTESFISSCYDEQSSIDDLF